MLKDSNNDDVVGGTVFDIIEAVFPTNGSSEGGNIIQYRTPLGTQADGIYWIITEQKYKGTYYQIAAVKLILDTPTSPFIYIDGGRTWPAGSKIYYELRNHTPYTGYDIYWNKQIKAWDYNAGEIQSTDYNGRRKWVYAIPITATQAFTYFVGSKLPGSDFNDPEIGVSEDIEVVPPSYIDIVEGDLQVPGSEITIELWNHFINSQYDIYVGGVKILGSPLNTSEAGQALLKYTLPSNLPVGEILEIKSYRRGLDPNFDNHAAIYLLNLVSAQRYSLTVTTVGSGTVSLSPSGIIYNENDLVNLSPIPESGWAFTGWAGDIGQGSALFPQLNLLMDAHKTVTATFTKLPTYTLSLSTVGQGAVTVNPAKDNYQSGTLITLTPVATSGWQFTNWAGAISGSTSPITLTMDTNKTITATFSQTPIPTYTLRMTTVGSGTVALNPAGGIYDENTLVSLSPLPESGWAFKSWTGDVDEGSALLPQLSLLMDGHKTITATFSLRDRLIFLPLILK